MKVLITGGAGFLGRHAVEALAATGVEVVATWARTPGFTAPGVRWERVDLLDRAATRHLIQRERPSHLLHMAWRAVHGDVANAPDNLDWTIASLGLVRDFADAGGRHVIGAGSVCEYDWSGGTCDEDNTPLSPSMFYGVCKAALWSALSGFAQSASLRLAWARIFFTYGPGENRTRFVSHIVHSLLDDTPAAMTAGEQIRDYVYATDIADALRLLVFSDAEGAFNIASGQPVALREIANEIARQTGRFDLLRVGALQPRPFEVPVITATTRKIEDAVGWRAATSLTEGVRRTIEDVQTVQRPARRHNAHA